MKGRLARRSVSGGRAKERPGAIIYVKYQSVVSTREKIGQKKAYTAACMGWTIGAPVYLAL